jgi:hypothetical protein
MRSSRGLFLKPLRRVVCIGGLAVACIGAATSAVFADSPGVPSEMYRKAVVCIAGCPDMIAPKVVYYSERVVPTNPIPKPRQAAEDDMLRGVYCGEVSGCSIAGVVSPPRHDDISAAISIHITHW